MADVSVDEVHSAALALFGGLDAERIEAERRAT
jgi:hypothetical protein